MAKDFEYILFRRGKHGALVVRTLVSGSNIVGGSVAHKRGRKQIREAMREGKSLLVRKEDGVVIRVATVTEILKAHRMADGTILVNDALDTDGVHWGCNCVVIRDRKVKRVNYKFDPKPRLVKRKE